MFQGQRFVTRGVADKVPPGVQQFLWSLIDNLIAKRMVELDYLQIFELQATESGSQQIIHRQEVPESQDVYRFDNVGNPLNIKLYVIDDECYSTMLLPEER